MLSRRTFLAETAVIAGSGGLVNLRHKGHARAAEAAHPTIETIRARTLKYVNSLRVPGKPYGQWRYSTEVNEPTLYSSTYAAMTRHLYRDLGSLTETQRREWIEYLQSHQDDDGLFRDPAIFGEGWYKNDPLWCGRPHLSCHVITALACLGAVANKPIRWLEPYLDRDRLVAWLGARDWGRRVAWTGNEVLNVGTLMQYARDQQGDDRCCAAVDTICQWMAERCDRNTGLWGVGPLNLERPTDRSQAVQAAYHFWLLWFYDGKSIPYADKAVVEVLRTQNPQGGFGCGVHNNTKPYYSSACEDIDSIDPLARLMMAHPYRRDEVQRVLTRALAWVLTNQNPDGGFVFMRQQPFVYGHPLMAASKDQSGLFPTWFRTLSLAYLGKALPESVAGGFNWDFHNCPGLQFWLTDGATVGEKNL